MKNKVLNFLKKNGKKYLEIASETAGILVHIKSKPSPLDYASIGLKICNSYLRYSNSEAKHPFYRITPDEKWNMFSLGKVCSFVGSLLMSNYPIEKLKNNYYAIDLDGNYAGIYFEENVNIDGIWVRDDELDIVLKKINNIIWESFSTKFITLSCKASNLYHDDYDFIFIPDDMNEIYPSKVADSIYTRIIKFLDYGYNRSVMLYGSPGTGKSAALKYISGKLNKKTLKISVSDVSSITTFDMSIIINVLKPEILIIDDFDRHDEPEKFLSELEKINKEIKVFLVSVNNINELDSAVIRPGRFDDIIDFVSLEPEIHDRLIGNVPIEIKERLKSLPIAYISDFHKRKEVLGLECAIEEIENLEKRINNLTD